MRSVVEKPEIDVKEAVRLAFEGVRDLYEGAELKGLLLEEVERSRDDVWLVTIGFNRPSGPAALGSRLSVAAPAGRTYKRIRIDAQTGEFMGMEIRQPNLDE